MRDYLYFMFILTLVLMLTVSKMVNGDTLSDCKDTLKVCDAVVSILDEHNKSLNNQINLQAEYIEELKKHVKANDSILPTWAWILVGAGAGIVTWEAVR